MRNIQSSTPSNEGGTPIPYKIIHKERSYDEAESMYVSQVGDRIQVSFTKKFPTAGYDLSIASVLREENQITIVPKIDGPASNEMTLQVITYMTVTLEIPIEKEFQGNVKVRGFQTESCSM